MLPTCPLYRHKIAEPLSKTSWPMRLTFRRQDVYLSTIKCQCSFPTYWPTLNIMTVFHFCPFRRWKMVILLFNLHSFLFIFLKLYILFLKRHLYEFFCDLLVYVLYFYFELLVFSLFICNNTLFIIKSRLLSSIIIIFSGFVMCPLSLFMFWVRMCVWRKCLFLCIQIYQSCFLRLA